MRLELFSVLSSLTFSSVWAENDFWQLSPPLKREKRSQNPRCVPFELLHVDFSNFAMVPHAPVTAIAFVIVVRLTLLEELRSFPQLTVALLVFPVVIADSTNHLHGLPAWTLQNQLLKDRFHRRRFQNNLKTGHLTVNQTISLRKPPRYLSNLAQPTVRISEFVFVQFLSV